MFTAGLILGVLGYLILLAAVVWTSLQLHRQAQEMAAMQDEVDSARRITSALVADERDRRQDAERQVIDFLA